jgi:hypothetical protein
MTSVKCRRHRTLPCKRHCLRCRQPACRDCIDRPPRQDGQCIDCDRVASYTGNSRGDKIPLRAGVTPPPEHIQCPVCRGRGGTPPTSPWGYYTKASGWFENPGHPGSPCHRCRDTGLITLPRIEPYYPGLPAVVYDAQGRKYIRLMCVACAGVGELIKRDVIQCYPATGVWRNPMNQHRVIPCNADGCYARGFYDRPVA